MAVPTQADKEAVLRLRADLPLYAEKFLRIRTKSGAILPLKLNAAQLIIHEGIERMRAETGKVRVLILKGRQEGASTYTAARMFHRVTLHSGLLCAVMTHEQDSTDALFGMAQRFQEHLPPGLKLQTRAASAKELAFETDSGYIVATAGNKAAGRGRTIQLFHGSEVASWPHADDHMAGIGQTVPDEAGTEIILESTAKGLGNLWHRMCMQAIAGRGDYRMIFVPWFVMPEYRRPVPDGFTLSSEEEEYKAAHGLDDAQMAFRRAKIDSDFAGDVSRWCEEYPATPEEAFQSEKRETFLQAADVRAARAHVFGEPVSGPLVLGVDPARFGDDRTALCWRKGREVKRLAAKQGLDTMQVAGMVVHHIRTDNPVRVFIDVIGIGAGVVDRLRELGYGEKVVAVNWAERAEDPEKYRNRRAEGWARMRDWLRDRPVRVPDIDALAQDLLQPGYKYDSSGRLQLESKDDIKKRGAPSPDLADSIALTFAEMVADDAVARDDGKELLERRFLMSDSVGY